MRNLPVIIPDRTIVSHDNDGYFIQPNGVTPPHKDNLRSYLNVLRRRKWCVILPALVIVPIVVVTLLSEEPAYQANARILIENNDPRILNIQEVLGQDRTENFFLTEYQMVKNAENIEELVKVLRLDQKVPDEKHGLEKWMAGIMAFPRRLLRSAMQNLQSYIVPVGGDKVSNPPDPGEAKHRAAIDRFSQSLQVLPQPGGKLVDIVISGTDPREVTQQANTLAEIYVRKNLENKLEAATKAVAWLTKQTTDLKQQTYDAELRLQKFREQENFIALDIDDKSNIVLARLGDLHNEYNRAHTARVDMETRLNNTIVISNSDVHYIENIPQSVDRFIIESISDLKRRYLELEIQLVELSKRYKDKHPNIITIKAQMEDIKRSIDLEFKKAIDALRTEYRVLRAREVSLEKELDEQKGKTLGLKNDMITYDALRRDVESSRRLYEETIGRLREIKLTQASAANNVKVVRRAVVPFDAVPSKAPMKMALSLMLSACLGVGLAFIREYFDTRFKEADEVEAYLGIPFLGIVPHYVHPKHAHYEPVLLHDPASLAAEAYRILRTRLQAVTPVAKAFVVTSAVPSEGKSTTTANLSIAFAQLGWHVLVVDADLRRPSLHRHFGRSNSTGLANILAEGADWRSAIQETSLSTLKLLPAGFSPRNPADLLNLKAMHDLLAAFRDAFELVIFDAPLVFSIPDVEILAPRLDGALLVHAPDKCEKESVVSAKNLLTRVDTKVLGIVFNNIRRKEEQYYYQYHRYYTDGNNNSHHLPQGHKAISDFQ